MRILVTGGTGFIGQHLVEALQKRGEDFVCLVRKESNWQPLAKKGIKLIFADLKEREKLFSELKKIGRIDVVFHLASFLSDELIPYKIFYENNVLGTKNLADFFLDKKLKRFVYYGSIAGIGIREIKGLVNEKTPCKPDLPYGRSKLETEKLLLSYFKRYRFPVVILRPPTVYGPGEKRNFLTLCQAIKSGLFKVIGSGKNLMSFCYVENLIQPTIAAAKKKRIEGEVFLVADTRPVTMREMAETIAKIEKVKPPSIKIPIFLAKIIGLFFDILSKIFKRQMPLSLSRVKTMTSNFAYDTSKAKKILGYKPLTNWQDDVVKTIKWYQENGLL